MSQGMITGFLHRAVQKGMVQKKAQKGNAVVYELLDRNVTWRFSKPSKGSKKGKHLTGTKREKLPPFEEIAEEITEKTKLIQFTEKTLSGQILDLAAMVEKLESRPLADFTTDQLLEEIKRRLP